MILGDMEIGAGLTGGGIAGGGGACRAGSPGSSWPVEPGDCVTSAPASKFSHLQKGLHPLGQSGKKLLTTC